MTIRNLDSIFQPAAIAFVHRSATGSAETSPSPSAAILAGNLAAGGFKGRLMAVGSGCDAIPADAVYADPESLPVTPDLVVISAPADDIPMLVDRFGRRGTRGAIIVSAGLSTDAAVQARQFDQRIRDAARPHLMRIVGPNSLGVLVPGRGVNASLAHLQPKAGDLAFLTQSGAVMAAVMDWAAARGVGFSHLVSLGAMVDVDLGDLLDLLGGDGSVRAILLYVETITHARKFMSAARAAARTKPVIVIKGGRTDAAAKVAGSHTGALVGVDAVYDAAFRRAGMLRVGDLDELFDAVGTLAAGVQIRGDRLAIVTNGGGLGVLATDSAVAAGGRLAPFGPATRERLGAALPVSARIANPLDIGSDADAERYGKTVSALMGEAQADAVLVLNGPSVLADAEAAARAVAGAVTAVPRHMRKPVLTSWLGEASAPPSRALFGEARIPTYATPEKAVRAIMHLAEYRQNQDLLMETPAAVPDDLGCDPVRARAIIEPVLSEGREWLTEDEAKQVLGAYGVPSVLTVRVSTPDEAGQAAEQIGRPVALKIVSPDITHKSDVGGVVLHLTGLQRVTAEAAAMAERIQAIKPDARLTGFTVQEMARKPDAHELFVGMVADAVFGPVLVFGQGGIAVEVVHDRAIGLPPLNMTLARDMITRTRVSKLLEGYRTRPRADVEEIELTLIRVSQLVSDIPEIAELDINPLLADQDGVLALDARIRVARPRPSATSRLAIRAYPRHLETEVTTSVGEHVLLRPIRPEDEPLLHAMFARLTPEDIRLRFFAPVKQLSHQAAARMTQIDYDREMAIVAIRRNEDESQEMLGVVRIAADPDNVSAEYAVLVRSDMKGQGLGWRLMNEILSYARARGLSSVHGQVLRENSTMLRVCQELGFVRHDDPDDTAIVDVVIDLAREIRLGSGQPG